MKINYRQRLYIYSFCVFTLFTIVFVALYINKINKLKNEIIFSQQKTYTDLIKKYTVSHSLDYENINEINHLNTQFPEKIRVTILDNNAFIIYDNKVPASEWAESKKDNVEIRRALISGRGTSTRKCNYCNMEFMYYTEIDGDNIIRIGYPLDEETIAFLRPNYIYLGIMVGLYIIVLVLITSFYKKYVQSIKNLKKFILSFYNSKTTPVKSFTDDELGEIQTLIVKLYDKLETNKKDTVLEREKLLEHFHYSEEGISFFTSERENIYTNAHFIQYLNMLLNEPTFRVSLLFKNPLFSEVVRFLNHPGNKKTFNTSLSSNGRYFYLHVIIFEDKSFEIIIRDVTDAEKNNFDRAEMTNSIAHELRTPVTSVRGYLETLLNNENMNPEKRKEFMNRAYSQINRLTEIIQDVVLLYKTNDAPQHLKTEEVNIYELLSEIVNVDAFGSIQDRNAKIIIKVKENVCVLGNRTLLTSIFRNLGNNAIKYAGDNTTITINNYMEDDNFYYFSFSDNGKGIEETHLNRIFDRFYRITEGRTRDKGGSGLGLAIVKDAIEFHHGEILAKNRPEGGLEFLFTLRKY